MAEETVKKQHLDPGEMPEPGHISPHQADTGQPLASEVPLTKEALKEKEEAEPSREVVEEAQERREEAKEIGEKQQKAQAKADQKARKG